MNSCTEIFRIELTQFSEFWDSASVLKTSAPSDNIKRSFFLRNDFSEIWWFKSTLKFWMMDRRLQIWVTNRSVETSICVSHNSVNFEHRFLNQVRQLSTPKPATKPDRMSWNSHNPLWPRSSDDQKLLWKYSSIGIWISNNPPINEPGLSNMEPGSHCHSGCPPWHAALPCVLTGLYFCGCGRLLRT